MAEYRLTPAAERDLEAIWLHTRQQWGAAQADRYVNRLAQEFADLVMMPQAAVACDHIRRGYRRRTIERHVIYFRIADYGIAVVRVLHERMDAARHLVN